MECTEANRGTENRAKHYFRHYGCNMSFEIKIFTVCTKENIHISATESPLGF